MNVLASLFAYAGLAALALAMSQHHRAVFAREIARRRRLVLRVSGWLLLALSVAAAFHAHGFELGAVAWFAAVASAGFILTLLLAYAPRFWPLPLAGLLVLVALAAQ